MTRYIIRRLLFFFPSVAAVSVFTFALVRSLPGNEVLLRQEDNSENTTSRLSTADITKKSRALAEKLGTYIHFFYL